MYKPLVEADKKEGRASLTSWNPVNEEKTVGTNWNTANSTFPLGGWSCTGTSFSGRLWSRHPWTNPTWKEPWANHCRWPCSEQGLGLGNLQRCLPDPAVLWFCNSVEKDTITWIYLKNYFLGCLTSLKPIKVYREMKWWILFQDNCALLKHKITLKSIICFRSSGVFGNLT